MMTTTHGPEMAFRDVTRWLEGKAAGSSAGQGDGLPCPQLEGGDWVELRDMLQTFVSQNEDPSCSSNYANAEPDDIHSLLSVLRSGANAGVLTQDSALGLVSLASLKILSRKKVNRERIGGQGLECVARLASAVKDSPDLAAECANVVLNFCYERTNVESFLDCGGVHTLATYLRRPEENVQANAAGALQSISYHERGRQQLMDAGVIPDVVRLMRSPNARVQARSVGAIHNLSSEPGTIGTIRKVEGIEALVALLRVPNDTVNSSAAGALQNISREVASRKIIKAHGAVDLLADLLSSRNTQAQVCAAGALLNILGPELGNSQGTTRRIFGKLLSHCLTLSVLYEAIWDQKAELIQLS